MAQVGILASDENNQQFAGARNPDDLLTVRFFEDAQYNEFMSKKESRPFYDNVIMISISGPGTGLINEIHRQKLRSDEVKFPRQWAYFQQQHSNDPGKMGTPLSQWPQLNIAQVAMLKATGFHTVEQIAFSSDAQISGIGMHGGMQPLAFRERAKAFLNLAKDVSIVQKQEEELKKRDTEIAELKKQFDEMKSMFKASHNQAPVTPQPAQPVVETVKVPKRRGRPPKQVSA